MAVLFNFPNCEQDPLQLDKVPLKSFGLAPFKFHNETSLENLPVINIFEKLLPCETCVFCQTCPCKPVEYTRQYEISLQEGSKTNIFR